MKQGHFFLFISLLLLVLASFACQMIGTPTVSPTLMPVNTVKVASLTPVPSSETPAPAPTVTSDLSVDSSLFLQDGKVAWLLEPPYIKPRLVFQDVAYNYGFIKWSPDGQWVAYIRTSKSQPYRYSIWLSRPDGTSARQISREYWETENPPPSGMGYGSLVYPVGWSEDSRWFVFSGLEGAMVNLETNQVVDLEEVLTSEIRVQNTSEDFSYLNFISVYIWGEKIIINSSELPSDVFVFTTFSHPDEVSTIKLPPKVNSNDIYFIPSPDGKRLLLHSSSYGAETATLWELISTTHQWKEIGNFKGSFSWSQDSRWLALFNVLSFPSEINLKFFDTQVDYSIVRDENFKLSGEYSILHQWIEDTERNNWFSIQNSSAIYLIKPDGNKKQDQEFGVINQSLSLLETDREVSIGPWQPSSGWKSYSSLELTATPQEYLPIEPTTAPSQTPELGEIILTRDSGNREIWLYGEPCLCSSIHISQTFLQDPNYHFFSPVWSPDGNQIAYVQSTTQSPYQAAIWTIQPDGINPVYIIGDYTIYELYDLTILDWAGDWIIFSVQNELAAVNVITGGLISINNLISKEMKAPEHVYFIDASSQSGKVLAEWQSGSERGWVIVDLGESSILLISSLPELPGAIGATWFPDEQRIMFTIWKNEDQYAQTDCDKKLCIGHQTLWEYHIVDGTFHKFTEFPSDYLFRFYSLDISNDGKWLALWSGLAQRPRNCGDCSEENMIMIIDLATHEITHYEILYEGQFSGDIQVFGWLNTPAGPFLSYKTSDFYYEAMSLILMTPYGDIVRNANVLDLDNQGNIFFLYGFSSNPFQP